jgi:hypothetical protein
LPKGVAWDRVQLEDLGRFVSWVRQSPSERAGNVTHLPRAVDHCSASTINRKLSAVGPFHQFHQFHQRHGVECEFSGRCAAAAALVRGDRSWPIWVSRHDDAVRWS